MSSKNAVTAGGSAISAGAEAGGTGGGGGAVAVAGAGAAAEAAGGADGGAPVRAVSYMSSRREVTASSLR